MAKTLMGKQRTEDKNNTHWKALSANDFLSSVCTKYKVQIDVYTHMCVYQL